MKPRELVVRTKLNGWEVKVGCQEVVFIDMKYMLTEISRYLADPEGVEKEYKEKSTNGLLINDLPRLDQGPGLNQEPGQIVSERYP